MGNEAGEFINQALVRILENALAGAKAGKFSGGGVLLALSGGNFFHAVNAGRDENFVPLIAGASVMETDLINTMRVVQQNNAGRLLRAGELPAQVRQ